jgi:K+ transporter
MSSQGAIQVLVTLMYRIFSGTLAPTSEDVVGAASCVFWSLTLIPLIKYSLFVIRASNHKGEGATYSFYIANSRWHAGLIHAP